MGLRTVTELPVLNSGSCEPLKAAIHATALGLSIVMGLYNAAAWLRRRQPHLAINAALYSCSAIWEHQHVSHHLSACRQHSRRESVDDTVTSAPTQRVA